MPAHVGIRTDRFKLICYLDVASTRGAPPSAIELFDLEADRAELRNLYREPEYDGVARDLLRRLVERQVELGDDDVLRIGA